MFGMLLFNLCYLYILIVFFIYSYCHLCSFPGIVFHCVVLCIVCVYMCTVLLPPGVNTIVIDKYIIYITSYDMI